MSKLSIITVNFNSSSFLKDCLESLQDVVVDGEMEILIYDNGPTDEGLADIIQKFPTVRLVSSERFISFSAANNRAADVSSGEYLFFLNPDTVVRSGAVEALIQFIKYKTDCGAVGPKLVDAMGQPELSYTPDPGIFSEAYMRILRRLPLGMQKNLYNTDNTRKVDVIVGAAMMVRASAFKDVGGFDEMFPLYLEDSDLCLRLRQAGWNIYYYPKAEIIHYRGQSGGIKKSESTSKLLTSNTFKYRQGQLRYYAKHKGKLQNMMLRTYLKWKYRKDRERLRECLRSELIAEK